MKNNYWNPFYDIDPQIKRIGIFALIYLIILLVIGIIIFDWKLLLNAFLGGAVSILNFLWVKQAIDKILKKTSDKKIYLIALKYTFRLSLMVIIIYVIIRFSSFHGVGFILGFSAIVIGVIIESLYQIIKGKRIGEI